MWLGTRIAVVVAVQLMLIGIEQNVRHRINRSANNTCWAHNWTSDGDASATWRNERQTQNEDTDVELSLYMALAFI